jgi:hypothetical protein
MRNAAALVVCTALGLSVALAVPAHAQEKKAPAATQQKKTPASASAADQKAEMDAMMKAMTPGPQHKMLAEFVGDWTFAMKMWMDPQAPPSEMTGTTSYKTIMGGRYLQGDHRGTMMGMPFEGLGIEGYDNVTGKYMASWIDNFGTGVMYLTGTYDPAKKAYTFWGDEVDPAHPAVKVRARQVVSWIDQDNSRMDWFETRGGKETKTMEIVYTRKK